MRIHGNTKWHEGAAEWRSLGRPRVIHSARSYPRSRPSLGAMARCHSFVTEDASRHDSERAGLLYALRSARQHDLLLSPSAYGGAEYSAA